MNIGDTVTHRHYPKTRAVVVAVWEFPDASRAQMCKLSRKLRADRRIDDTWKASELRRVQAPGSQE